MYTVMTILLAMSCISARMEDLSDGQDPKSVIHEIKRIYKWQMSIKECRAICSRQRKPECLSIQIHDSACVQLGRQSLNERVLKASCSGTSIGTTGDYRMTTYTPDCPEGFSHLMQKGKRENRMGTSHSCYQFIRDSVDWWTAADICRARDSGLVSIETPEEQTHIERILRELKIHGDTWTSGYDWYLDGNWAWTASTHNIEFKYWTPGQPDRHLGNEKCLNLWTIQGYKWNDASCDWEMNLLCERDAVVGQDGRH